MATCWARMQVIILILGFGSLYRIYLTFTASEHLW